MDPTEYMKAFNDYLAPRLDTYEQAIYLYLVRHSRLEGSEDIVIVISGAAKSRAFGTGNSGVAMAPSQVFKKLRSLETKGCVRVLDVEHQGTRIQPLLPHEIPGLVPLQNPSPETPEDSDFYGDPKNRLRILVREEHCCFYCLRQLTEQNFVIDHIVSRPVGHDGYSNVVAACRSCNNRKRSREALDHLRLLYRENRLTNDEFDNRLGLLERIQSGDHPPPESI